MRSTIGFIFLLLFFNISYCQDNHDIESKFFSDLNNSFEISNELTKKEDNLSNQENNNYAQNPEKIINGIVLLGPGTEIDNVENIKGIKIDNLCLPGSKKSLQKYLKFYLGQKITSEKIECIKESILKYYQKKAHPFILVTTPEQKIKNGVIIFVIYESTISDVKIKGNKYFNTSLIQNFVSIKKGESIDTSKIVQDLYWINKNPFRNASAMFQSGIEELTTDVEYLIQDRRTFRIYTGAENTGFETTGKNRVYAGFNWGNVWNLDHILTFQYTTSTKFSRFQSYTASYALPFLGKNLITVYGGYSWFKPSMVIPDFKNEGTSYQISARYTFPLLPYKQCCTQDFSVGFDAKNTNTNLTFRQRPMLGNATLITQLAFIYILNYETDMLKMPLEINWFFSPGNIFPNQKNSDYSSLRYKAKNRYLYMHVNYSPYFKLPYDMNLLLNFQGQLSTTNLLSSEQFGLGGYNTVRGYEYREVNKDNGIITSLEFIVPSMKIKRKHSVKNNFKFLTFVDFGIGWDHKKTPEIKNSEYLLGVGPGIRFTLDPYFYFRLDWAYKLHKTIFEPNAHRSRWHFGLTANY